jgi:predicted dehydrogenase
MIQVGVGGRGGHWLDFIAQQRKDVVPVAFVDASTQALNRVRARPGLEKVGCFERLEEALRAVQADFALIASPSFLHAPHAMQALDSGLGVLVEKPFGSNLAEATALARRARAVGRPAVVAENYRFFQAERTLRAFLESGVAGRLANVVCIDRRDQSSSTQGPWVKSMPHPFLTEIAVHHFDSFRYLFGGRPATVFARSFNLPASDYDHEAGAHALIDFPDGPAIQYSGSFVGSRYQFEMTIYAENGDLRTDRVRVWWRPKAERSFQQVPPRPLPPGEVLRYPHAGMATILDQFRAALEHRGVPETLGEDNLWTLAMHEAAILSAEQGRRVALAEVYPPSMWLDRESGSAAGASV